MRNKSNKFLIIIFSLALVMAVSGPAMAQTSHADVFTFLLPNGDPADGHIVGRARLHRSAEGASLTIETTELEPGSACSVWWVIFNNPAACDPAGCSDADFETPEVEASLLNATGRVADADGNASFSAFLPAGAIHTEPSSGNLRQLFGPGLQNVKGAEIHVVMRSHGPATGNVEQLSTLLADCLADDGSGGLVCFDGQAAVFPLPN